MQNIIGLITYHAAYNYGSVLQAFATQKIIESLGFQTEIINYRMQEQKNCYALYRKGYGKKVLLLDLMQFPINKYRQERAKKFEEFIEYYLNVSEELNESEKVYDFWNKYDIVISGSDQIWNKHSNELHRVSWEHMRPYLLHNFQGRKISYASSLGYMAPDELYYVKSDLEKYDYIAMREIQGARKMSALLERDIVDTIDPTLLLTKEEWKSSLGIETTEDEPYILYYSLGNIKEQKSKEGFLINLAQKLNCKVHVVTPFAYYPFSKKQFIQLPWAGPIEFIKEIANSRFVVTNSFHGTTFALNFNKDFYSFCRVTENDYRREDLLARFGLENRLISNMDIFDYSKDDTIDYQVVNEKINKCRVSSMNYLKSALNNCMI